MTEEVAHPERSNEANRIIHQIEHLQPLCRRCNSVQALQMGGEGSIRRSRIFFLDCARSAQTSVKTFALHPNGADNLSTHSHNCSQTDSFHVRFAKASTPKHPSNKTLFLFVYHNFKVLIRLGRHDSMQRQVYMHCCM